MSSIEAQRDTSLHQIRSLIDSLTTELKILQSKVTVTSAFQSSANATHPSVTLASDWFDEREKDLEGIKGNIKTFISFFTDFRNATFDKMNRQDHDVTSLHRKISKYREEIGILREKMDTMEEWSNERFESVLFYVWFAVCVCVAVLLLSVAGWCYLLCWKKVEF